MENINAISRAEHEEFVRRMDEANQRQDARLKALEETSGQIHALAISVEKLAQSVENMAKAQEEQGERLKAIENRDGELFRKMIGYALTAGVGFLIAALLNMAGIF